MSAWASLRARYSPWAIGSGLNLVKLIVVAAFGLALVAWIRPGGAPFAVWTVALIILIAALMIAEKYNVCLGCQKPATYWEPLGTSWPGIWLPLAQRRCSRCGTDLTARMRS